MRLSLSLRAPAGPGPARPDRLRILFCGADEFSVPSLRALANMRRSHVADIDVLCRPPKSFWRRPKREVVAVAPDFPAGAGAAPARPGARGTRKGPIEAAADRLGLPTWYVDRFGPAGASGTGTSEPSEPSGQPTAAGSGAASHGQPGGTADCAFPQSGWLDKSFDLIVAVSFGLKIPAWLIERVRWGGINIHPSFLPDLRGSSPIIRSLLLRRPFAGITIQTLHPHALDAGRILLQTARPGYPLAEAALAGHSRAATPAPPLPPPGFGAGAVPPCSPRQLTSFLAQEAVPMLQECISRRLFEERDSETGAHPGLAQATHSQNDSFPINFAPKITAQDCQVDWLKFKADDYPLRESLLGELFDSGPFYKRCSGGTEEERRVIFHCWDCLGHIDDLQLRPRQTGQSPTEARAGLSPGEPILLHNPDAPSRPRLGIVTADHLVLAPVRATIELKKRGVGLIKLVEMMRRQKKPVWTFASS